VYAFTSGRKGVGGGAEARNRLNMRHTNTGVNKRQEKFGAAGQMAVEGGFEVDFREKTLKHA
jgi:hypothetical protein